MGQNRLNHLSLCSYVSIESDILPKLDFTSFIKEEKLLKSKNIYLSLCCCGIIAIIIIELCIVVRFVSL